MLSLSLSEFNFSLIFESEVDNWLSFWMFLDEGLDRMFPFVDGVDFKWENLKKKKKKVRYIDIYKNKK